MDLKDVKMREVKEPKRTTGTTSSSSSTVIMLFAPSPPLQTISQSMELVQWAKVLPADVVRQKYIGWGLSMGGMKNIVQFLSMNDLWSFVQTFGFPGRPAEVEVGERLRKRQRTAVEIKGPTWSAIDATKAVFLTKALAIRSYLTIDRMALRYTDAQWQLIQRWVASSGRNIRSFSLSNINVNRDRLMPLVRQLVNLNYFSVDVQYPEPFTDNELINTVAAFPLRGFRFVFDPATRSLPASVIGSTIKTILSTSSWDLVDFDWKVAYEGAPWTHQHVLELAKKYPRLTTLSVDVRWDAKFVAELVPLLHQDIQCLALRSELVEETSIKLMYGLIQKFKKLEVIKLKSRSTDFSIVYTINRPLVKKRTMSHPLFRPSHLPVLKTSQSLADVLPLLDLHTAWQCVMFKTWGSIPIESLREKGRTVQLLVVGWGLSMETIPDMVKKLQGCVDEYIISSQSRRMIGPGQYHLDISNRNMIPEITRTNDVTNLTVLFEMNARDFESIMTRTPHTHLRVVSTLERPFVSWSVDVPVYEVATADKIHCKSIVDMIHHHRELAQVKFMSRLCHDPRSLRQLGTTSLRVLWLDLDEQVTEDVLLSFTNLEQLALRTPPLEVIDFVTKESVTTIVDRKDNKWVDNSTLDQFSRQNPVLTHLLLDLRVNRIQSRRDHPMYFNAPKSLTSLELAIHAATVSDVEVRTMGDHITSLLFICDPKVPVLHHTIKIPEAHFSKIAVTRNYRGAYHGHEEVQIRRHVDWKIEPADPRNVKDIERLFSYSNANYLFTDVQGFTPPDLTGHERWYLFYGTRQDDSLWCIVLDTKTRRFACAARRQETSGRIAFGSKWLPHVPKRTMFQKFLDDNKFTEQSWAPNQDTRDEMGTISLIDYVGRDALYYPDVLLVMVPCIMTWAMNPGMEWSSVVAYVFRGNINTMETWIPLFRDWNNRLRQTYKATTSDRLTLLTPLPNQVQKQTITSFTSVIRVPIPGPISNVQDDKVNDVVSVATRRIKDWSSTLTLEDTKKLVTETATLELERDKIHQRHFTSTIQDEVLRGRGRDRPARSVLNAVFDSARCHMTTSSPTATLESVTWTTSASEHQWTCKGNSMLIPEHLQLIARIGRHFATLLPPAP